MRLDDIEESSHVEDRTGYSSRGGSRAGSMSIASVVIALLLSYFLGINPLTLLGIMNGAGGESYSASDDTALHRQSSAQSSSNDPEKVRMKKVLMSTEKVWTDLFSQAGATYQKPTLVLFSGQTSTACGLGQSAMGPFYCPADSKVYIDTQFFQVLHQELGAPGDFAQAYVLAHEVGHHVQNLMGVHEKVEQASARLNTAQKNALSVRVELQADCLAGIWAKHANDQYQLIEPGDIEEAMNAAEKIGDDALQRAGNGEVVPDSFTHGTSAQRMRWYNRGLQTGSIETCDSFATKNL